MMRRRSWAISAGFLVVAVLRLLYGNGMLT